MCRRDLGPVLQTSCKGAEQASLTLARARAPLPLVGPGDSTAAPKGSAGRACSPVAQKHRLLLSLGGLLRAPWCSPGTTLTYSFHSERLGKCMRHSRAQVSTEEATWLLECTWMEACAESTPGSVMWWFDTSNLLDTYHVTQFVVLNLASNTSYPCFTDEKIVAQRLSDSTKTTWLVRESIQKWI